MFGWLFGKKTEAEQPLPPQENPVPATPAPEPVQATPVEDPQPAAASQPRSDIAEEVGLTSDPAAIDAARAQSMSANPTAPQS